MTVTIECPSAAVGDGATPIRVLVNVPSARPRELENLQIDASAGRVIAKREVGPDTLEVSLVPPKIVEELQLMVKATTRRGQRARAPLRLVPEPIPMKTRVSNGPLDLRVPESMVLGQELQGNVTFRSSPLSPVTLYASVGVISAPQADSGARLRAIYSPPADKLPAVALIVAAADDGSVVDWAAIRLIGRPLVAATSEPHATVVARVAGVDYGPVQADERGRAEIRVLAPPGIKEAQTIARDAMGNERIVPLKLGVVPTRRAFAICPANSESLFYFAVNATGDPERNLPLQARSSLGELTQFAQAEGGYYASSLVLPANATLGQSVQLQAQALGDSSTLIHCETSVAGEAPTQLELSVAPAIWVAGSSKALPVLVHARFSGNRRPRVVPIRGTAEIGELGAFRVASAEQYAAEWRLPAHFGRQRSAKLSVETLGARRVRADRSIELRPGAPARLRVTSQFERMKADGRSESQLTVTVLDAWDNLVDSIPQSTDVHGTVTPFRRTTSGVFVATYQTPDSTTLEHDDVRIGVTEYSVTETTRIRFEPHSDRFRLWGAVGYASNFAKVSGPMGNAGLALAYPLLHQRLVVGADISYLVSRQSEPDAAGAESVTVNTTAIPVGLRAAFEYRLGRFAPYLGLGAGVGFVRFDVSAPSAEHTAAWKLRPTFAGFIGSGVALGPGSLLVEVAYRYLPLADATVSGNVGGLGAIVGYSLAL